MDRWKTVDLTKFNTVPLTKLKADKKYIMYGNGEYWPRSRWIIKFKRLLHGGEHIIADVLDIKLKHGSSTDKESYLGEDDIIKTSPFIFYDYDDIFKMKSIIDTGRQKTPRIPSLASMSQHQLPTSHIPIAKHFDQLGLKSVRETGGKKTIKRANKNKRKTYRGRK